MNSTENDASNILYLRCRRNVFREPLSSNDRGIYKQTHRLLSHDTDRTEDDAFNNSSVVCIYCLGKVFTEPLPSKYMRGYKYTHTDGWEGLMKYAVEMD
jgi:hypothetical protein